MSAPEDELFSLLIPLAGDSLVVPRACVTEVAPYREPDRAEDAPAWHLGQVEWEHREIPLVSFEALCGQDAPAPDSRTRLAVFRAVRDDLKGEFFALACFGLPQLVRLNPAILAPETEKAWPDEAPVLCRVRMVNQRPLIPDLDRIEALLA